MKLICHIVNKDLRKLRIPLASWMFLRMAEFLFFAFVTGVGGESHSKLLLQMQNGLEATLTLLADPLIIFFLVGMLVFEDPLVEKDAFWITRPITGGMLLTAKIIGSILMFVCLPVLTNVLWWLACGFGFVGIVGSAVLIGSAYFFVVLGALAMAAATDGFPRLILWTIVTAISFTSLHLLLSIGTGAQSLLVLEGQMLTANTAGFWRYAEHAFETFRAATGNLGIYFLGWAIISIAILARQYLRYSFSRVATISVLGALVCLSLIVALAQMQAGNWYPRMQAWLHSRYQITSVSQKVSVKMGGKAVYQIKGRSRPMTVPIMIEGLRDDQLVFSRLTDATWSMSGVLVWTSKDVQNVGSSIDVNYMDSVVEHLIDQSKRKAKPVVINCTFGFVFSDVIAKRMLSEPMTFHCSGSLDIFKGTVFSELPLAPYSQRVPFGSFSIGEIRREGDKINFVIAERRSVLGQLLSGDYGHYYYALLQRSTGKIVGTKDGWFWSSWDAQLNLVSITCVECSFPLPKVKDLADFALVVIGFHSEAASSPWTLDANPLPFGGILSAEK